MNFLFFGDGAWATLSLQRLLSDGHHALGVVLRRKPSDALLSTLAVELSLPMYQPKSVNADEFVQQVCKLSPDLNISFAYDQILRAPIVRSAGLGFINCHAGALPAYRGRNIINWAIINGESSIGLTVHYIDEGIDTGDIILQERLPIQWEDTYGSVLERVTEAFPDILAEAVRLIERGEVRSKPQDHLAGTYFSARIDGDEWIDWSDTSLNTYNKIRAITHPGPGARTLLDDLTVIIWKATYDPDWPKYIATPGEVIGVLPGEGVRVKTGDSTILLKEVQIGGDPPIEPKFRIGTRFGTDLNRTVMSLRQEVAELRKMVLKHG